jgi:hypothetical protein
VTEKTGGASFITGLSGFFGRLLLPLGLFSVLAVGLHIGSDKIDDHLFVFISFLDSLLDSAMIAVVRAFGDLFNYAPAKIDQWTFAAAELIDVEEKASLARMGALAVELLADLILALPVFFHRADQAKPKQLFRDMRDPTVLKISLPLAAIAAGLAGTFAVSRELQVLTHSRLIKLVESADLANFIASSVGFIALCLVVWRVLVPIALGAMEFAHRRANNDRVMSVSNNKRRMRGWITALVALPVAMLALLATPVLGTLRALLWM